MATLTRRDGQQYVLQAYRETLSSTKTTRVVRDIRQLAEAHGQFVRIFKKDTGQYEAAFAGEPGYLLGETVRYYFGYPKELIYCEYLPEARQVIVVVVRGSNVYIDVKVSVTAFESEIVPALTGDQRYQVHLYGDVPLSRDRVEGKLYFPEEFIESFEQSDESLFGRLPTLPNFQLLPLPYALKATFMRNQRPWIMAAAAGVVFVAFCWWILSPAVKTPKDLNAVRVVVHPFMEYYKALETPSVNMELKKIAAVVDQLYTVPGWHAATIDYSPPGYLVLMSSDGGAMEALQAWADAEGFSLKFTARGAQLVYADHLTSRAKPSTIYNSAAVIETIVDHVDGLLQEKSITVGTAERRGRAYETQLNVQLDNVSPEVLALLGAQFKGYPVSLRRVSLRMNHGLLSGLVNLSVWGSYNEAG
jgi:hypothetical protein